MNKEELVELLAKSQDAILERVDSKLQELKRSIYKGQEELKVSKKIIPLSGKKLETRNSSS